MTTKRKQLKPRPAKKVLSVRVYPDQEQDIKAWIDDQVFEYEAKHRKSWAPRTRKA